MAKSDTTPIARAPRKHEQKRGRYYLVNDIRKPSAGIFVCFDCREIIESKSIKNEGSFLSRKICKISTARRVLKRIRRQVPTAFLAVHASYDGALFDPFKRA